jgi:cytochrome c5
MRPSASVYLLFLCVFSIGSYASSHHPQDFLSTIHGSSNEGLQVYNHFCVNCHAQKPLIPLGAPRFGVEADWTIRLQQDMGLLFKHTDEGVNAMPPRGGCFECSDEQLVLAIITMLPKETKKDLLNRLLAYKKNKK